MSDGLNWGRLVEQDRAKAIGVSWSDEELKAIYEFKIPPDFVRAGCLTLEQYNKAQQDIVDDQIQGKEKKLRYMRKDELLQKAQSLGLSAQEETTRAELILLIEEKLNK